MESQISLKHKNVYSLHKKSLKLWFVVRADPLYTQNTQAV